MRYLLFFIRSVFYFFIFLRNFYHQSEWKWSICSDSHHTPHTVYAIEYLIRLSMNDYWLELFNSVNEQSRYLLFFIRSVFYFFIFLQKKYVMSEWKWSIYSDSHHTPHTVYAIEFLIRLSMDCIWLVSFDSVNEQSRYLLFFIR